MTSPGDEQLAKLVADADAHEFKTGIWKIDRDRALAALGVDHPLIAAADRRAERIGVWFLARSTMSEVYRHGWDLAE